jgi:hypothetical protein
MNFLNRNYQAILDSLFEVDYENAAALAKVSGS